MKREQLKNEQLSTQVQQLTLKVAELEKKLLEAKRLNKKTNEKKTEDPEKSMLDYARKFGVMYEMFIEKSYLLILSDEDYEKNSIDPYSLERYEDDETKLYGIYAEVYDEIPKGFHQKLRDNKNSAADNVSTL